MSVTVIAALTLDGAIGRNGDLLYHISDDLKHFKKLTLGHPVVMGRKTFESLPGGPLPGRRNIVVTRNGDYRPEGVETVSSIDEAIALTGGDCFIIGGGEIYGQAIKKADALELTVIDAVSENADTFFPVVTVADWKLVSSDGPMTDPRSGVCYNFRRYERI